MSEEQLRELPRHATSPAFSPLERAALDLAVALAAAPCDVPPDLEVRLREHLDTPQLVELASAIAWESYRARFNRVFGIEAAGFTGQGACCALPEPPAAS